MPSPHTELWTLAKAKLAMLSALSARGWSKSWSAGVLELGSVKSGPVRKTMREMLSTGVSNWRVHFPAAEPSSVLMAKVARCKEQEREAVM